MPRRQLRLAVVAALGAIEGLVVTSPGNWPTSAARSPEAKCRVRAEQKTGISKSIVQFNTSVEVEIEARLQAATAEGAQDQIEDLAEKVETAVLCAANVVTVVQQVSAIQIEFDITAEGSQHIGAARFRFLFEIFEVFDLSPAALEALQEIALHVDAIVPFDATGTYASPPFPDAVTPAPRAQGPDGRDEGALLINLPQEAP